MSNTTKLKLKIPNEETLVRVLSGIVAGGLTKKEMVIVIWLMKLLKQENKTVIDQSMRERVRLGMGVSSQTMHNYWNKLKSKKVILGTYRDYELSKVFNQNLEITLIFSNDEG